VELKKKWKSGGVADEIAATNGSHIRLLFESAKATTGLTGDQKIRSLLIFC
jgi:hypothetical protein